MILILPITETFNTIYACNLVCKLELAFTCLFGQNFRENCKILRFFQPKIDLCLFFVYILNMFTILRLRLHYDVIVTSYADGWYLFWYQWIEEAPGYTFVANIRVQDVYHRKSRGGCNSSPSEDVLQKMAQEDEGYFFFQLFLKKLFYHLIEHAFKYRFMQRRRRRRRKKTPKIAKCHIHSQSPHVVTVL